MNEGKQATPHSELIEQLMDSRVPKTEREHAAQREIEMLREALRVPKTVREHAARREIEMLREALRLPAALAAPKPDYERGFIDGMQEQMKRSVDQAVRAMSGKCEWQGLTAKDLAEIPPSCFEGAIWADAKLREKNCELP